MYVLFENSPGAWSVGTYTSVGTWIHDSDHVSKLEAKHRVISLNQKNFPASFGSNLTIKEVLDYLHVSCQISENKSNLRRLENVLMYLSNSYVFTHEIDEAIFNKAKNSGTSSWYLYLQIINELKILNLRIKNELLHI